MKTGLPIISLFGDSDAQRHPQPQQMRSLDAVVIDLQDAGVRFYTYETEIAFAAWCFRAAIREDLAAMYKAWLGSDPSVKPMLKERGLSPE